MKFITLNNEILDMLNKYSDWFMSQDLSKLHFNHNTEHNVDTASSIEYLNEIKSKTMGKGEGEHAGPPEIVYNCHFGPGSKSPQEQKDASTKLNDDLVKFLGARQSAVHVYYPEKGFMGWHCNWDVPGYNILINYNAGDGWFKYWDTENDSVVTMHDPEGWSAKVGYYGGKDDPVWHCAGGGPRITLGFVIPQKEMWEMMIEDISIL